MDKKNCSLGSISTIFSDLFHSLTSQQPDFSYLHGQPPNLTFCDLEMLKMFLCYDIYIYLYNMLQINNKEENMFKPQLIRSLLIELLKDEDHTLTGIESVTHIPIDVLEDIIYEINPNPSISVSTAIINYYIISKRQEYTEFIRKIFQWVEYHYLNANHYPL